MCLVLGISRSSYYYESKAQNIDNPVVDYGIKIFREIRNNYGTRKIKVELQKLYFKVSRHNIGRIMRENGLISNYTAAQFKVHKTTCNESQIKNEVTRHFDDWKKSEVIVSDLTYVRVNGKWNHVCILVDLYNREIIGCSADEHKSAELVYQASARVKRSLLDISIFHSDHGNEFKNRIIDTFNIKRSLINKGIHMIVQLLKQHSRSLKRNLLRTYALILYMI